MANDSNTLYVAIDASGVQSGASVTINMINQMMNATDSFNSSLQKAGAGMDQMGATTAKTSSAMSKVIKRLSNDFSVMGSVIAAAQPVHLMRSFTDEIVRVNQVYTGFIATMAASTDEYVDTGKAYEYVKDVANAYGTSIEQLLSNYAKLKGATNTLLNTKQIDHLFESVTALSSVMHLPAETVNRVFMAFTQIASKGQLMMEELKSQLGEHLPGALAIAAASMGKTVRELMDAMKKGEISAKEALTNIPAELDRRFAGAADLASKSLNSVIARFNTAMFDTFKQMSTNSIALGLSAAIDSVTDLISDSNEVFIAFSDYVGMAALKVADFVKSLTVQDINEFKNVMTGVADSFIWLVEKIIIVIKYIKEYAAEVLLGIKIFLTWRVVITYGIGAMTALAATYGGLTGASLILTKATKLLSLAFKGLFVLLLAYEIGDYLYNEFATARKGINYFLLSVKNIGPIISKTLDHVGAAIKNWVNDFTGIKIFDVTATDVSKAKSAVKAQLKAIQDEVNADDKAFRAKKKKDGAGSVAERMGIDAAENAELKERLAEFVKDAADLTKDIGLPGQGAGSKSAFGARDEDRYFNVRNIKSKLEEANKAYTEFSQKLKTLNEMDQISTAQMYKAQIEALKLFTDKSKQLLTEELLTTKDPKVKERLNSELIKLEHDYQTKLTKVLRDEFLERRKLNEQIFKMEVEGRVRTQSPTESFLSDWSKDAGMTAFQARQGGDDETSNRIIEAMRGKLALVHRDEKISIESMFNTDTENAATGLFLKLDEMKQKIKATLTFSEDEKASMMNFLDEKFIIEKNNIIVKSFQESAGLMSQSFGKIGESLKNSIGESSAAYKAIFAISKAFAIAEAILNLNTAIAQAAATPSPDAATKFANMAAVAAAVGGIVSQISSVTFAGAFDKGGNIPAGQWGIVGEVGPEIVKGPANVTSRKDTAELLKRAGGSGGGGNISIGNINVTLEKADDMTASDQAQMIGQAIEQQMRSLVVDEIRSQSRPGNSLNRNSTVNVFA